MGELEASAHSQPMKLPFVSEDTIFSTFYAIEPDSSCFLLLSQLDSLYASLLLYNGWSQRCSVSSCCLQ